MPKLGRLTLKQQYFVIRFRTSQEFGCPLISLIGSQVFGLFKIENTLKFGFEVNNKVSEPFNKILDKVINSKTEVDDRISSL